MDYSTVLCIKYTRYSANKWVQFFFIFVSFFFLSFFAFFGFVLCVNELFKIIAHLIHISLRVCRYRMYCKSWLSSVPSLLGTRLWKKNNPNEIFCCFSFDCCTCNISCDFDPVFLDSWSIFLCFFVLHFHWNNKIEKKVVTAWHQVHKISYAMSIFFGHDCGWQIHRHFRDMKLIRSQYVIDWTRRLQLVCAYHYRKPKKSKTKAKYIIKWILSLSCAVALEKELRKGFVLHIILFSFFWSEKYQNANRTTK